jgi:hypothetical protein
MSNKLLVAFILIHLAGCANLKIEAIIPKTEYCVRFEDTELRNCPDQTPPNGSAVWVSSSVKF